MAQDPRPQPASSRPVAEHLMADVLSAEELHALAMRHDAEEARARRDEKTHRDEELRRRLDTFRHKRELTPEAVERAVQRWQAAARQGAEEVEILRFPSQLCLDEGRAVNNGEADWGRTLVGLPRQVYEIWDQYLRHRGFRLKAYVVDFPEGKPGDVGMFICWG